MSAESSWTVEKIPVDQMAAAAGHLIREWGEYGYRIGVEAHYVPAGVTVFLCSFLDGSQFRFISDRYCNIWDVPEELDTDLVTAIDGYSSMLARKRLEGQVAR